MIEDARLNESQKAAIAELTGNVGYQLLLQVIEAHTLEVEAAMSNRNLSDAELLRHTRYWQIVQSLLSTLKFIPANLQKELDEYLDELRAQPRFSPMQ